MTKKRWIWLSAAGLCVLGILSICTLVYVRVQERLQPFSQVNYAKKLNDLIEARQGHSSEENGWSEFVALTQEINRHWQGFVQSSAAFSAKRQVLGQDLDLSDPRVAARQDDLLPELRSFFEKLDQSKLGERLKLLAGKKHFVAPQRELIIDIDTEHHFAVIRIAQLQTARLNTEIDGHNPTRLVESIECAVMLSEAVQSDGLLISWTVATVCKTAMVRAIMSAIIEKRLDVGQCEVLLPALQDFPDPDVRLALQSERLFSLETIDESFRHIQATSKKGSRVKLLGLTLLVSRQEQIDVAERLFSSAERLLSQDEHERRSAHEQLTATMHVLRGSSARYYQPLSIVIFNIEDQVLRFRRAQTMSKGACTMLALELFRAHNGHYPESLNELVPTELKSIPSDPFGANTPLCYKLIDRDGTSPAKSYVLYSIGSDGKDDGGKSDPQDPSNGTVEGPDSLGYDYLINVEKPLKNR